MDDQVTHNGSESERKPRELTAARTASLALRHEDLTAANGATGWFCDLPKLLQARPELHAAWRRGRFLRHIRRLGASGARPHEAARELGMTEGDFRNSLAEDIEAAELWNEARVDTAVRVYETLSQKAGDGNRIAMAEVVASLKQSTVQARIDPHCVAEPIVCEIFAVSRQTLNRWVREHGCPRNTGTTTYDLPAMVCWFKAFVRGDGAVDEQVPPADMGDDEIELMLRVRRADAVQILESAR